MLTLRKTKRGGFGSYAPPMLKHGKIFLGQSANILFYLGGTENLAPKSEQARLAAESQYRDLEAKIEQEAERIAGSVANDLAVARAQVLSLESKSGDSLVEVMA